MHYFQRILMIETFVAIDSHYVNGSAVSTIYTVYNVFYCNIKRLKKIKCFLLFSNLDMTYENALTNNTFFKVGYFSMKYSLFAHYKLQ